ncbi:MAG: hypothetical protein HZB99_04455 [Candidatus Harrisonbacteria bacterium]|nr:hypothetical protein [Candidatus Harrisonbacteria bacterium]
METELLVGTTGAIFILIAFIFNQTHRWKDDDVIYDLFNLIGGLLLVTYAFLLKTYPFLILNSVWALVSLMDVFQDLYKKLK